MSRSNPPARLRVRAALPVAAMYVVSIAAALFLCALLVQSTGGSATKVLSALVDGSVRSPGAWGLTITTATPLLVVAVGTIVASKAGMSNIGQEGQLLIGAAATAFVGTRMQAPGPVIIAVSLGAGLLVGGFWALLAAVMRFTRGVPEVISTLLLLFIAVQVTTFGLTKQWLLLSRSTNSRVNIGEPLKPGGRMPTFTIFGNAVSWGAAIATVVALTIAFVMGRTTTGFRIRMLGLNQRTARRAGVSTALVGGGALVVSGAAAGLAGGLWLTGGAAGTQFSANVSSNIGWQGLLVALLARERAVLAVPMAFVFAALRTGSSFLAATGVDRRIANVVQAMLVLALLIPPAIQAYRSRRGTRRVAVAAAAPEPAVWP
jgi:simple sugar transport system permease protein